MQTEQSLLKSSPISISLLIPAVIMNRNNTMSFLQHYFMSFYMISISLEEKNSNCPIYLLTMFYALPKLKGKKNKHLLYNESNN